MSPHKAWSIAKSLARLIGCLALASGGSLGFVWFAWWFAIAEVLGILEELGEP